MGFAHTRLRRFGRWLMISIGLFASVALAQAAAARHDFQIGAGEGSKTLLQFGVQADLQVLFDFELAREIRTREVHGNYEPAEALSRMLQGTGLVFRFINDWTVSIVRTPPASTESSTSKSESTPAVGESYRVAAAQVLPAAGPATQASARSPESSPTLEEVIVTAQKREESIRSVPISISAVTAVDLAARHIQSFEDLSRAVPNLSFSSLGGQGLSNLQIRGVSSQAGTATVSVYIDDVSLTTRNLYSEGTAEPRVFDLSRVEVLRGPQGTLYGASALGGTIRFVTQQPKLDRFEGEVFAEGTSVGHGGTGWNLRSIVNIPLATDRAALRLGAESGVDGGYVYVAPLATGDRAFRQSNRSDWNVGKAALLLKPSDSLAITAAMFYQRYHSDDTDIVNLDGPTTFVATKGLLEPGTDTLAVPSLTVSWDAGIADLTAVTGFYHREFNRVNDLSVANAQGLASGSITDPAVAAQVFDLKSANYLDTTVNQISQEIRLASKPLAEDDRVPVTWLVGAFFSNQRTSVFDSQPIFGINAAFAEHGADPSNPEDLAGGFPNAFVNDLSFLATRKYRTRQYAGFGEATYHLASSVRLTAGFRYLTASETFDRVGNYYYSACHPSVDGDGCPATVHLKGDFDAFTPKFAFGWDVNPDVTMYANITKGFRLGSENRPVPLYGDPDQDPDAPGANSTRADLRRLGLTSVPATYEPDSLWNYEIGTKSLLFERRLALDLSVFYIRWKDIQQTITLATSGYDFEANAGSAKSYGFELAGKARLPYGFTLEASGGYTRAKLDSGVVINGQAVNDTFPGQDVAGVPRWSGTLAGQYDFDLAGAEVFVRSDANYIGKSHGTLVTTDPDYTRPAYTVFGASAGVTFDRYEISLFANNLTDNDKIIRESCQIFEQVRNF